MDKKKEMNFVNIFLAISLLISCHMSYVEATCCGTDNYCSMGGWCCGCGSCNIFCCNCDNGCNRLWWAEVWGKVASKVKCGHKKREITNTSRTDSLKAGQLFKKVDIDGNNVITMAEANSYLINNTRVKKSTNFSIDHELRKMDTNRDGLITQEEFDSSLKF